MKTIKLTRENLKEAVLDLNAGEVLEVPTDTVRGFICDYYNKSAEEEMFRIKKRPKEKILSIFVSSIAEGEKIRILPARARSAAQSCKRFGKILDKIPCLNSEPGFPILILRYSAK